MSFTKKVHFESFSQSRLVNMAWPNAAAMSCHGVVPGPYHQFVEDPLQDSDSPMRSVGIVAPAYVCSFSPCVATKIAALSSLCHKPAPCSWQRAWFVVSILPNLIDWKQYSNFHTRSKRGLISLYVLFTMKIDIFQSTIHVLAKRVICSCNCKNNPLSKFQGMLSCCTRQFKFRQKPL